MFISLEGPDSAGKSTQAALLKEYYERQGRKVEVIHFPMYESHTGSFIKKILDNHVAIDNRALQMIYIADQIDYQKELQRLLDEDVVVIADRYDLSTIAYYQGLTGETISSVIELIHDGFQRYLIKPDITFIFNLKGDITERREADSLDLLEKNADLMSKVSQLLEEVSYHIPFRHFQIINANDSIENVHEEIVRILEDYSKEN